MLEIDCHITQDGEVVVCHDEDLHRLTGKCVLVHDVQYQVLYYLRYIKVLQLANSVLVK